MKKHSRKITRGSVQRYFQTYVDNNNTDIKSIAELFKPKVPGTKLKVPLVLLKALKVHTSMMQVSGQGEAKLRDILGTISIAIEGTQHKKLSVEHIYKKLKKDEPESLQKGRQRNCKDIRSKWTTAENIGQWFDDSRQMLIDEGFAEDMRVVNLDGSLEELYIPECKRRRCYIFDEADHPLSNEGDSEEARSGTFIDIHLSRSGSFSTRGSRHVSDVAGNTAIGECLPSLFIFDSKAMNTKNYKVKPEWCKNLPSATGRWGV